MVSDILFYFKIIVKLGCPRSLICLNSFILYFKKREEDKVRTCKRGGNS